MAGNKPTQALSEAFGVIAASGVEKEIIHDFGFTRQAARSSSCLAGSAGAMWRAIRSIRSSTGSFICQQAFLGNGAAK